MHAFREAHLPKKKGKKINSHEMCYFAKSFDFSSNIIHVRYLLSTLKLKPHFYQVS